MKILELIEDIGESLFGDKRHDALLHFAEQKRFQYRRRVNPDLLPLEVQKLDLFSIERSKRRQIKGFLHRQEQRPSVLGQIFDYAVDGKRTTVYFYQSKALDLPTLKLTPRSSLSKFNVFGKSEWSDIDKTFAGNFDITSDDMNAMRMLVTIQFAEIMNELEGYTVEGRADYLIIYRLKKEEDIIDMDNVYAAGLELADIILHDHSNELV